MTRTTLALIAALALASASADEMSFPEIISAPIPGAPQLAQPFLVMGKDKPVLTEKQGLAAPALWDWDGDGRRDLLVGDFEINREAASPTGTEASAIRVYRNVGTDDSPAFIDEFEWARDTEGKIIQVPQWCCMGFTPYLHDLDGDGYQDIITGQYHPGDVTWFRGSENGFLPRLKLRQEGDPASAGYPRITADLDDIETFYYWAYSSVDLGDLDDDGDLDLIVGGLEGLRVSENIGGPKSPSFAERTLLLDVNGEPLKVRDLTERERKYRRAKDSASPAGDGKTSPHVTDWDNDGVLDLLVTDSYRGPESNAVTFFRGVKTSEGHRFEPGIELLQTRNGEKALPGSGQRIYVADWNNDGIKDLIIGASVATVNDGEFSDELSWEWENVTGITSAGKDAGLRPPQPRPTLDSLKSDYENMSSMPLPTDEELLRVLRALQEQWDKEIGRLYDEGKEHWLTLRHQGRVYVMLGTKTYTGKASPTAAAAKDRVPKQKDARSPGADSYPVQVSLSSADSFAAGAESEVGVIFSMREGWYIYAPTGRNALNGMVETSVEFEFPDALRADGAVHYPAYRYKDVYDVYMENAALSQSVVTASDTKPGTYEVTARVTFQACKEDMCLPPRTQSLTTIIDLK